MLSRNCRDPLVFTGRNRPALTCIQTDAEICRCGGRCAQKCESFSNTDHRHQVSVKILLRHRTGFEGTSRIVEAKQEGRGLAEKKTSSKVAERAGERVGAG